MRRLLQPAATVLLLFIATLAHANDLTERLMQLSGINQQLDNIPLHIQESLEQAGDMPADTLGLLSQTMADSFSAKRLKKTMHQQLSQQLGSRDTRAVLAWLESPLGQKITALEIANASSDAQQQMQAMLPQLLQDTARFALIRVLDQATKASSATISMVLDIQKAMLKGMMAGTPAEQQLAEQQIDAMIDAMQPQIQSQYELMVIASMAYSYRSLSEDEIRQYIDFANSSAGKKYHRATIKAMGIAMGDASLQAGKALSAAFADSEE